ncbi:hypothetical protein BJ742DRAFT_817822 [Cladochytrium replicatum]|nr:hypothetical protein BJ742DRAFT_817822 [Cladochytrium replicatum]
MAPKENSKAVAGREKKAAVQAVKDAKVRAEQEAREAAAWNVGAKDDSRKADAERKKAEAAAKKAERDALLAAEEASTSAKKPVVKGASKVAARREAKVESFTTTGGDGPVEEYSASGLDAALDLLSVTEKGTLASSSDKVERHPEKRMKSAWAAFEERELPLLKAENPSLRLTQLKQMLQKKWKKSPENPLNQSHVQYNTTRGEEVAAIENEREQVLETFRQK